jgi:hypothetical protein
MCISLSIRPIIMCGYRRMNIRSPLYWGSGIVLAACLAFAAWFIHSARATELSLIMGCADDSSRPAVQWVCKKNIYLLRVTPDEVKELNTLAGAYFAVQLKDKADAEKMLKFFLSRGVDINSVDTKITNAGLTALHNAVYANEPNEVELLLAYGAKTEVRSHKNQTPLELAWALQYLHPQQDRSRIIQLLAEGGPTK